MKALIITSNRYPRSGAASNYIQYFSLMLKECGYEVTVAGVRNEEVLNGEKKDNNINVINVIPQSNDLLRRFLNKFMYKILLSRIIKKCCLSESDIVIDYSCDHRIYETVLNVKKQKRFLFACCPTEWFPKDKYDGDFEEYTYINERLRSKCDLIFPISDKIENHYKEKGCKTFKVPIMCDSTEYNYIPKKKEKYKLILPANGKMKDALSEMLLAVSEILSEEIEAFEFHITGVTKEQIIEIIGEDVFSKISRAFVIHDWMKYEELVQLYQGVHYLLLAREDNQMTQSNFPSKIPECMCYGIVPIMSNVGDAPKYYLKNKINSIVFEGHTVDSCKQAICAAVELKWNAYRKLSESARRTAETQFDYRRWNDRISEVIKEARGYNDEN